MDNKKAKEDLAKLNMKRKRFGKEFSQFALKGNAMSLAVGVIIGAAFQGLVNSVVNDLINPIIGLLFKVDFSDLYIPLFDTSTNETYLSLGDKSLKTLRDAGLPVFAYGNFISTVINFFLLALVVYFLVKIVNKVTDMAKRNEPEAAPTTKKCPFCDSDVPIKAVRCPHCTSELPKEDEKADEAEDSSAE